jgi:hypothetical protein
LAAARVAQMTENIIYIICLGLANHVLTKFMLNEANCTIANFDQMDMEVCNLAEFGPLASQKRCYEPIPNGQLDGNHLNQNFKNAPHLKIKHARSKSAILIGNVLAHEIYIFGKRR